MSTEKKDYMLIKLTRGLFAKVDAKNFHRLNEHKWYAVPSGKTFYAIRKSKMKGGKKRESIRMHNEIMTAPDGHELDHRNRNGIDNRENNLRSVTHSLNLRNYEARGGNSKYKGVCWHKRDRRWGVKIVINYKQQYLGYFDSEKEAAMAYDDAAYENFGVYAYLNFPERHQAKAMDAIL